MNLKRGFSNLRSLVRDDDFREKPGAAEEVYDPDKTVRLILVTATILEDAQSDIPNPAK